MRVKLRRQRTYAQRGSGVAKDVYPTARGVALRATEPPAPLTTGSDRDTDDEAGRCWQCGQAIENMEAHNTCPFCTSDNFRGTVEY